MSTMQTTLSESAIAERDDQLMALLSRCALRDQAALRNLYDLVAAKLNGIAFRITGSRDLAEDVLQISFNQIWKDAAHYRPDIARPMTWMTSIVRHRSLDKIKAERRRTRVIDESVALETEQLASKERGPLDLFELGETKGKLSLCLERLSDMQQRSVLLAYYYGFSREEISTKLDAAVGTVKSWLHRGLQRLEQCLTQ